MWHGDSIILRLHINNNTDTPRRVPIWSMYLNKGRQIRTRCAKKVILQIVLGWSYRVKITECGICNQRRTPLKVSQSIRMMTLRTRASARFRAREWKMIDDRMNCKRMIPPILSSVFQIGKRNWKALTLLTSDDLIRLISLWPSGQRWFFKQDKFVGKFSIMDGWRCIESSLTASSTNSS